MIKKIIVGVYVAAMASMAGATTTEEVKQACLSASNLDEPVCRCVAEKSGQQLSAQGREFVVESLAGDDQRTAQLREKMAFEELMAAGMFMTDAPADCAKQLNSGGN